MAEEARKLARRHDMNCEVLEREDIVSLGMGAFAAVAAGSANDPRLIILEHAPAGHADQAPLIVVGQGITFDSHGNSITHAAGMWEMKGDMGGAAAVMGVSGSIQVSPKRASEKENDEVTAIAIVAIMGTIFALLEIAILPAFGLNQAQEGFIAGGSLHEIAHAVAAGDGLNNAALAAQQGVVDAATMANIMKLSRVLMLVFVSIIVAIWWDKRHSEVTEVGGKRKVAFPWFMLGFIATAAIGTLLLTAIPSSAQFVSVLGNDVAKIFLGMAMAALGINVNFKAIAKTGIKPFIASLISSIILVAICYGLAVAFF